MAERSQPARGSRRSGFTLIELLAVVLILGLLAAMVAPNVGFGGSQALRSEADQLADALEFARQRAIMTGRPHRVWLDLDWSLYRVEWQPPAEEPDAGAARPATFSGTGLLPLHPPVAETTEFVPVPGGLGRDQGLAENVAFAGVELDRARKLVRRGAVAIAFEPDGIADAARVWLADVDGEEQRLLEVRPLADAVVVSDAGT